MESNERYYRRRAAEELAAARRAVTPAARNRRMTLAQTYVDRLRALGCEATCAALDLQWNDLTRALPRREWILEPS